MTYSERVLAFLLKHMTEAMIEDGLHLRYGLNPEDTDDLSYSALKGLVGRDLFNTWLVNLRVEVEAAPGCDTAGAWFLWKKRRLCRVPKRLWPWFYLAPPR